MEKRTLGEISFGNTCAKAELLETKNKLRISFEMDGYDYVATLSKSRDNKLMGGYTANSSDKYYTSGNLDVKAKIYQDDNALSICGQWIEDGGLYYFFFVS